MNTPPEYKVNHVVEGEPTYIGRAKKDGTWLVEKFSPSTGVKVFANRDINKRMNDYGSAWIRRNALTYTIFQNLHEV